LKKLYSLKFDKVFLNNLKEDSKNTDTIISENKNIILNDTRIPKKSDENSYADEMVSKVKEFLENFNYNVNESLYTLSNSVIRVKIKLPL
jgi:mevalonate kinase